MLLRLGRGRWFVRRLFDGIGDGLDEQEVFFLISYFLHGLRVEGRVVQYVADWVRVLAAQ